MIPFVPTTPDTGQRRRSIFSTRLSKPKPSRSQSASFVQTQTSNQPSTGVPGIVVSLSGQDESSSSGNQDVLSVTPRNKSYPATSGGLDRVPLSTEQIRRGYEPSIADSTFESDDASSLNPTRSRHLYSSANSSESRQPLLEGTESSHDGAQPVKQGSSSQTYTANAMSVIRKEQSAPSPGSDEQQPEREWKASYWDTSSLSEEKIAKLKKKGINPALYLEMKAARKGKKISPLCGSVWFA